MKSCPTCQTKYADNVAFCSRDGMSLVEASLWSEGSVIRGKYRIQSKVGQGGMGAVYKATHVLFDELRALKVINPEFGKDDLFVRRFQQEAVITRKLQHPNAVRVDDIDEAEDGRPFIVMEYIEGRNIKQLIQQYGHLPFGRVCSVGRQVAAALDAAHRLGMIHRDIKPANIVLVETPGGEQAKVLDFGIAKLKEARTAEGSPGLTLTGTGAVIGTAQYMSPEQAQGRRGDELDGRSDIYSLGIVMYQMLTGELPFKADTSLAMLIAHITTPPKPIREARPDLDIPLPIAVLVMRCLEKKPELRPSSAKVLQEELDRAEQESSQSAAVPSFEATSALSPPALTNAKPPSGPIATEPLQEGLETQVRQPTEQQEVAREWAEAERLWAERAEAERLAEAAKAEQEKLERERIERERQEAERAEAARRDQEKAERERLERERSERERKERERTEAERRLAARAEAERLEREKAAKDERERSERERRARERAEAERQERERVEREARERERAAVIRQPEAPKAVVPLPPSPARSRLAGWQLAAILLIGIGIGAVVWHFARPRLEARNHPSPPVTSTASDSSSAPSSSGSSPSAQQVARPASGPAEARNTPPSEGIDTGSPSHETANSRTMKDAREGGALVPARTANLAANRKKSVVDSRKSVEVASANTPVLSAPAPPSPAPELSGPVTVNSSAGGAEVYLDDQLVGQTNGQGHLEIPPLRTGSHRLRVALGGYETNERSITLMPGESVTLSVGMQSMKPQPSAPPAGTQPVARFQVTHKHTLGSSRGILTIGNGRVAYEDEKGKDSFDVASSAITQWGSVEIGADFYLKLASGKTYYFNSQSTAGVLQALQQLKAAH